MQKILLISDTHGSLSFYNEKSILYIQIDCNSIIVINSGAVWLKKTSYYAVRYDFKRELPSVAEDEKVKFSSRSP